MLAPVVEINSLSRSFTFSVGKQGQERPWTENEMIESIEAFAEATKCILHLAYSWLVTKKKEGYKRKIHEG